MVLLFFISAPQLPTLKLRSSLRFNIWGQGCILTNHLSLLLFGLTCPQWGSILAVLQPALTRIQIAGLSHQGRTEIGATMQTETVIKMFPWQVWASNTWPFPARHPHFVTLHLNTSAFSLNLFPRTKPVCCGSITSLLTLYGWKTIATFTVTVYKCWWLSSKALVEWLIKHTCNK